MDWLRHWTRHGRERWERHLREARILLADHGLDKARALLRQRADDTALTPRDRRHWHQVLKALESL